MCSSKSASEWKPGVRGIIDILCLLTLLELGLWGRGTCLYLLDPLFCFHESLTLQEAGGADSARPEEKLSFWYILVIQLTRKNLTFPKLA